MLQPQFTHLLATRQHKVLREVFKISSAWSVLLAWPIYLAIGCAPAVYLSVFGDSFVDHYSATREWEEREFRKAITEWELDRYMEII